jgi:hypothetical protein
MVNLERMLKIPNSNCEFWNKIPFFTKNIFGGFGINAKFCKTGYLVGKKFSFLDFGD